jgi:glutathione S-transferase
MYTLFWSERTAAIAPDAVLSEAGADFTRKQVKRTGGRVDDPEFEKISPMKQIPALLLPDGTVLCESLAICPLRAVPSGRWSIAG